MWNKARKWSNSSPSGKDVRKAGHGTAQCRLTLKFIFATQHNLCKCVSHESHYVLVVALRETLLLPVLFCTGLQIHETWVRTHEGSRVGVFLFSQRTLFNSSRCEPSHQICAHHATRWHKRNQWLLWWWAGLRRTCKWLKRKKGITAQTLIECQGSRKTRDIVSDIRSPDDGSKIFVWRHGVNGHIPICRCFWLLQ